MGYENKIHFFYINYFNGLGSLCGAAYVQRSACLSDPQPGTWPLTF